MPRTEQEIAERVRRIREEDFFGFETGVLLGYLPYKVAVEFLRADHGLNESDWEQQPLDDSKILAEIAAYMTFAWDKATNHRGLSAGRSVSKLTAWSWLLGDDTDWSEHPYTNYGAPVLKALCERYGLPMPDDEAARRMARGEKCTDSCEEGCG